MKTDSITSERRLRIKGQRCGDSTRRESLEFSSKILYRQPGMMHFDEKGMWGFRLERDSTFRGVYMAGMGVCEDPSCPCTVVTIGCKASDPAPDALMGVPYMFSLDLDTRKLVKTPTREGHQDSTEFGRSFVRELEEADWAHLRDIFLSAKRSLTENLNPEKVKYQFYASEIEDKSIMISYINVFPFEDKLHFTCDSREHLVSDYYCLKSSCRCKDVHLVFHEQSADSRSNSPIAGSLTYSYDSQTHRFDEDSRRVLERVEILFHSLKTARPDLASVIRKRHKTLRLLYGKSLLKNHPPSSPLKVGRNDPCPCGSGRKFKHCCGR